MKISSISTRVDETVPLGSVTPGLVVRLQHGSKLAQVGTRYHATGLHWRGTPHGHTKVQYLGSGGQNIYANDTRVYIIDGEFVTDSPFSMGE